MTGKIIHFSRETSSGIIRTDSGASVPFDLSSVMAYDAGALAANQFVTFELEDSSSQRAFNVCVLQAHRQTLREEARRDGLCLRYLGFEQKQNIRAYRFECIAGDCTAPISVTTDLGLFIKHHVALQDGPALCWRLLMATLESPAAAGRPIEDHCLTDGDMLAHRASQPLPRPRPNPRHVARTPGTMSAAR